MKRRDRPSLDKPWRLGSRAAIMAVAAAVCAFIQSHPSFMDPDSFYHAKMAVLMQERGLVTSFPWLPFTTLADAFADHHLLYHAALIPFVAAFGPLVGTKVAAVVFAAAAMVMFLTLLQAHEVKHAFLFTLVLATAGGFLIRLNLAKAGPLSLCAVMGALILMHREKALALFALSWVFVWLYGGWPLMLLLGVMFLGAKWIAERTVGSPVRAGGQDPGPIGPPAPRQGSPVAGGRPGRHRSGRGTPDASPGDKPVATSGAGLGRSSADARREGSGGGDSARPRHALRAELRCGLAILGGLAAGIVVNPYFPKNVAFYWEQIVQIVLLGHRGRVDVGGEWYPYPFGRLVVESAAVFLVFFLAALVMLPMALSRKGVWGSRPLSRGEIAAAAPALLLAILFLFLTLRSRRYVEYFAPFAMFGSALLASSFLRRIRLSDLAKQIRAGFGKLSFVPAAILVYIAGLFLYLAARDVLAVRAYYRTGIPWTWYSGVGSWLAANTPENAIVFHSGFDVFPILFFHDDRNRYISGLDPTFFYRKDPDRYARWVEITRGEIGSESSVSRLIRDQFNSRIVVIGKGHEPMRKLIERDAGLQMVYEDRESWIYRIL